MNETNDDIGGVIVNYAMVLKLPVDDVTKLEKMVKELKNARVLYRKTSLGKLYILPEGKE